MNNTIPSYVLDTLQRTTKRFPVGSTVKHSSEDVRRKHDYYLLQGQPTMKSRAKQWYEDFAAERGTVKSVEVNSAGHVQLTVEIGGRIHHSVPYKFEPA